MLFCAILTAFLLIVTVAPRDYRTVEIENRNLNTFPVITFENLLGGTFGNQFEAYVSDRVWQRSVITAAAKGFRQLRGFRFADGAITTGSLLSLSDRNVELFYYKPDSAQAYADVINLYRSKLPENVRVFSLLAPTQIEFMAEKYRNSSDAERLALDAVSAALSDGVTFVDAYDTLAQHYQAGDYIYFRSDHHWTALGAYYAYCAYAEAAGIEPLPLSAYTRHRLENFLGYLYNTYPRDSIAANPDAIEYYTYNGDLSTEPAMFYPPEPGAPTRYGIFLNGDHDIFEIHTSVGNGKTAILVKDSYANAFAPWLAPHYENIVLLDPRTFEGTLTEVAARYGNDVDVIVLNYALTTRFDFFITAMADIA
jgi:hypothetical protein